MFVSLSAQDHTRIFVRRKTRRTRRKKILIAPTTSSKENNRAKSAAKNERSVFCPYLFRHAMTDLITFPPMRPHPVFMEIIFG